MMKINAGRAGAWLLVGAMVVPSTVLAQEISPEDAVSTERLQAPEIAPVAEEEAEDERLDWDFRLTSEVHSSDNAGFRQLDEENGNQERIETDDRHTFAYTSIAMGANYKVLDDTTLNFSASHSGLWGSDQLGGTNDFGGFFYVYDLNVDWQALDLDAVKLNARFGRQAYTIGGTPRDYFMRDNVDGLTLNFDFGAGGKLRVLAFDLFASQGRPDTVSFLRWHAGRDLVYNMRGETNTFRYGGVYENTDLIDGLEARAFGYFASIGGAGTGADRTHEGTLGNFSDNDFSWLAGARASYYLELDTARLGAYGEYAYSGGIDRKEVNIGVHDVAIDGQAFGAGVSGDLDLGAAGLHLALQYFRADGAQYGADGLQFNHGFVSMGGSYAGGLNMGRYNGWRPSAYVSREGIAHSEHDIRREGGTQILHGGLGVTLDPGLRLDLGAWMYQDTGSTNLDFARLDAAGDRLPSGYSRDQLEAQQRLGKSLGTELNASLSYQANEALSLYGMGGIFLPGEFYEIEITRNAGSARGSVDNLQQFWAVSAGATLVF
ncbi:hypothetical protein FRC96_15570 [Lujinxingia vulgaris]|uniref:Alginate export domain-containing protein n=1 Tax=Lujinxingia vulgaris TaxID=2600176 RepID=A0A5C6X6L5_9DELT|nr:hypothetical protein [Lujinxingia vulgaris]TXD33600.1 hypothetical protein FRC96_15570 [Lujinxingia vulgaris]